MSVHGGADGAQAASLRRDEGDLASNQKLMQTLTYSRSGQLAAAGNIDGVVYLFDMQTRQLKARFASKYFALLLRCPN